MGIEERREREKRERRELILKSAMQVYLEEGYHATTMDKIAQKAELSRATLYLYFKTKEEIFVHAIVSFLEHFGSMLDDLYSRKEHLKKGLLKGLWSLFLKFYIKDPVIFNISLYFHQREMIHHLPGDLRVLLDRAGSHNYHRLCRIMEYGVKNGIFLQFDPKTLAEVVWTAFLGVVHIENSKKAMARKNHLEKTCDLAYEILSKGMSPTR